MLRVECKQTGGGPWSCSNQKVLVQVNESGAFAVNNWEID